MSAHHRIQRLLQKRTVLFLLTILLVLAAFRATKRRILELTENYPRLAVIVPIRYLSRIKNRHHHFRFPHLNVSGTLCLGYNARFQNCNQSLNLLRKNKRTDFLQIFRCSSLLRPSNLKSDSLKDCANVSSHGFCLVNTWYGMVVSGPVIRLLSTGIVCDQFLVGAHKFSGNITSHYKCVKILT